MKKSLPEAVEMWPIDRLKLHSDKARTHSKPIPPMARGFKPMGSRNHD
jgi:hypothetical protein